MKLIPLLLLLLLSSFLNAQHIVRSTIGSWGNSSQKSSVIVQQTVAQPCVIMPIENADNINLRQGFLQPFIFSSKEDELNVLVYPNPNNGDFMFRADLPENSSFEYNIIDMQGKSLLSAGGVGGKIIPVSLKQQPSGIYFLQVISKQKTSAFKISIIQ